MSARVTGTAGTARLGGEHRWGASRRRVLLAVVLVLGSLVAIGAGHGALQANSHAAQEGGIFRVSLNAASGLDYVDPALASSPPGWAVLDTTCARFLAYPDKAAAGGVPAQPEVATGLPRSRATARRTRSGCAAASVSATGLLCARARSPARSTAARARDEIARASSTCATSSAPGGACRQGVGRRPASSRAETRWSSGSPARPGLPAPDGVDLLLRRAAERCRSTRRDVARFRPRARTTSSSTGRASASCCGGTGSTAARGRTTSTGSTSISALPRRRRCSTRRARRGRLGPHARRHLLRPRPRPHRQVRDQPLALFLRPGFTLRMLALQLGASALPGQPEPAPGGQLRARPPGDRQRRRPAREPPSDQYLPSILPGFKDERRLSARAPGPAAREGARARATCAAGRPSSTSTAPRCRWRSASSSSSSSRRSGSRWTSGHPAPQRVCRVLQQAGDARRAVGHRFRPLETELRRSVRVHQPALRRPLHRGNELRALHLEDRRPADAKGGPSAAGSAVATGLRGARRPTRARRRADRRRRLLNEPTLVSSRVGCIVLRPVLDLTAVCLVAALTAPGP